MQIALSQGLFATVDAEDYAWLRWWKWSAMKVVKKGAAPKFYAVRVTRKGEVAGKPKMILMHRAITKAPKGKVVDHQDGDGLNNARGNIRICTQGENCLNQKPHRDGKSQFKGVCWHKGASKWCAEFRGKYLGLFDNEVAAAAAYNAAASMYSPEYSLLNTIATGG